MSPEACRRFVIPLICERTDLFRQYGAAAMMHCCGGIAPIVGDLVDAGVQVLNPIQSAAQGMDRAALEAMQARSFVASLLRMTGRRGRARHEGGVTAASHPRVSS